MSETHGEHSHLELIFQIHNAPGSTVELVKMK